MTGAAIAVMAAAMAMPGGGAAGPTVAVPGRFYAPQQLNVLAGQTVTWRNDDTSDHTVTSPDAGFDSGRIGHGGTFSFTFDQPGVYEYACTIHRYMKGTVEVDTLGLQTPDPVVAGGMAMLHGAAPPGTGTVTLLRLVAGGATEPAGTALPDGAGAFAFTVPADAPARFRAESGELRSGEARLDVAPRLVLSARRVRGRRVSAHVSASPGQARGRVVLERYVAERYGWVRVRAATLGRDSASTFTVGPVQRRISLRARLAKPVGGYAAGVSPVVRVR
jgi:plastocyanin